MKGDSTVAIRTKEELMESIRSRLGDDNSDEAIGLLEDISDTYTDMETKANGGGEDWKSKYEANDAAWRQKYRDRFFGKGSDDDDEPDEQPDSKPMTYEQLFKEG